MPSVSMVWEGNYKSDIDFSHVEDYWFLGNAYKLYDENIEKYMVENLLCESINAALSLECLKKNHNVTWPHCLSMPVPPLIIHIDKGFYVNPVYLREFIHEIFSYQQPPYICSRNKKVEGKSYSTIKLIFPDDFRIIDRLVDLFNPLIWEFYNKPTEEFWWEDIRYLW